MTNQHRGDANRHILRQVARQLGACVKPMEGMAGFDDLVVCPYGALICEYKDPATNWKLTPNEAKFRHDAEEAGGAYYIIETVEEMIGLLRGDVEIINTVLRKGDKK